MYKIWWDLLQANHALLEEIREINLRLIDTVVDISDEDVDPSAAAATAEGGEGTIVKCSFSAVALSSNLKSQYMSAQMVSFQIVERKWCINLKFYAFLFIIYMLCCYAVTNSAPAFASSHKLSKLFPNTIRQVSCWSQVRKHRIRIQGTLLSSSSS